MHYSLASLLSCLATVMFAAEPAVVSNIRVLSDRVADVSSLKSWEQSIIRPGMSDAEKVMAAVESVVAFGHHEQSPLEFAALDSANMRDPIKLFNVYGYGTDASSVSLILLWRYLGFPARAWTVNRWGMVPEVFYNQAWHAYDPIMVCWFRKPDGAIASVEELAQGVRQWYETHPELKGDQPKLRTFLKENGVAQGPEILRDCPTYDQQGNFRFNYFGWYTAMLLYDGDNKTPFLYEESGTQGYRVNNQLQRGEKLTLRWSNSGKHANQDGAGGMSEMLTATSGKGVLHFTPACGDLANGRIGNGTLDWTPTLDAELIANALVAQNIVAASGALRPQDGSHPASLVLRRASSYLFLGGQASFDATIAANGGITVELSDDLGHSWSQLSRITATGPASIDLAATLRHYDYRLRLVLDGKGTSLSHLHIINDIQHSQRALPALAEGINHLTGSTGPAEGVVAVEGAGPYVADKGVSWKRLGIATDGLDPSSLEQWNTFSAAKQGATIDVPIETPGDLTRLHFSFTYRAGQATDGWACEVSTDGGVSFKTATTAVGPCRFNSHAHTVDGFPAGIRRAIVRYRSLSAGMAVMFRQAVYAEYREPQGGFAPIRITYHWTENGIAKQDQHTLTTASDTWTITCATKPILGDLVLERVP